MRKERKNLSHLELCHKARRVRSQPFVKETLISEQQKTIMSEVSLFQTLAFFFPPQGLVSPLDVVSKNKSVCVCYLAILARLSAFPCATEKGNSKGLVSVRYGYSGSLFRGGLLDTEGNQLVGAATPRMLKNAEPQL